MDGANADSDHSMTWEDFFGSTTDLTPTLIGIYDSLLQPAKKPSEIKFHAAKDSRNEPPLTTDDSLKETNKTLNKIPEETYDNLKETEVTMKNKEEPQKTGSVKLPTVTNKSTLYTIRTKVDSESVSEVKKTETNAFDNLSPNVKRMISSATDTTALKFQKKSVTGVRASIRGHRSNIPLIGATSKISQSGVDILPSVEIYDQPSVHKNSKPQEPPSKTKLKPNFKIDSQETYDVPSNNKPLDSKTAFESLSLPYIDQSIELSISTDREFDPKIASKETSPKELHSPPSKIPKTGSSLHRNGLSSRNGSPAKQVTQQYLPEEVGSTPNLKDKELQRLNPPTVEVSRPLSMSSIASSSSTSSSGVQNKGGVNSAYLASIESLDDHSDADMISAGSNNFVNTAGMDKSASEERRAETLPSEQYSAMSGLSQLERVCAEIVHTENSYVQDLEQVVEGYLHVWKREATFSAEELSELFNNIEDIYNFNKSLCSELNSCRLDETCIARCFVNNTSGFSVYTSYCTGYPRTMERLAALASSQESAREFRERQIALGHPLPLASYLLKPVQRILKYHLLLQNVVKQCASRETEYALLKMTGIAQHIDDMKRRHEHAVRVQEIQSLLYGWNGPDLTTYGELCAEGTFRVFGAKAMRHVFLFDKMLLVTKNREDGILAYKSHIMCNNMMLVESIAGAALSFHVIPWDAPRAQLTLQAATQRHKREWTLLLKRVILENYNAVIPSHARQLVMELGQNKTDDDMLAEKSHNLITQASMRKQLSAPEYLEKRKLDRERRKSFENNPRGRPKKVNRKHTAPVEVKECDCAQVSIDKGIDYTCENCYVDLCSDCDTETKKKEAKCDCIDETNKCPECDRSLHYIDAGSAEHLERKLSSCKCSDFKSSQESFNKDFISPLNKTRGYHSSDNIVVYTDSKSKEDLTDINNSMTNVRNMPKTCLKCVKIKENIVVTESNDTLHPRKSRCIDTDKHSVRSKSKDDPHRVKLSKIGTWRRKSEPGLQQNNVVIPKKNQDDNDRHDKGSEKIEFECRNCGSNKISRKSKTNTLTSDPDLDGKRNGAGKNSNVEIKMYNTKNVPTKISKLKKSRAKGLRLGSDTTAKFYADLSTDVSTENILHISESTDSLNVDKVDAPSALPDTISKDESIDEETYKKLIEKTDSFKKNELEKGKYLNKQKVINEGSEDETQDVEIRQEEVTESCEETEQPLEQIISQLLLQNREFQKLLKKQQLRNTAHRRHQRLLKSHSNPEQPNPPKSSDSLKLKPKYGRQTSELIEVASEEPEKVENPPSKDDLDEDHIYETLRVEPRVDETLHSLNSKSKSIQHNTRIARPKRLPSPPDPNKNMAKMINPDADYVYLSFDKLDQIEDSEGIYDVPIKSPEKVPDKVKEQDYYVTVESKGPVKPDEDLYDNIIEVCRRKKEPTSSAPGEYLPMSPEHSPNTPEIWLSRQKEHFNVSRDRKSGSLPRSFQVVSTSQEEPNMTTFKTKSTNGKTYLNRDGKVMSTERPFTIASDQSEISYDDVETYMNEGDIPKFNKANYKPETEATQDISQSTLELEEEIDRCYKNNFESIKLDANKNENLAASIPNLNTSTTSSCEVLTPEKKENSIIHPEHKIYKPNSNMLSLKNVLSRFKSRKNNDEEVNANENSSPESKTDLKSPTSEKRSALNPRSYSKNLLQRFRSIIGDEHDDNHNKGKKTDENNLLKSEIKVVITSTEASPTTSTIVYNDPLSKSVYEKTTLTESQSEKNNLDLISQSCDNITKAEPFRPNFEKSVSMVTTVSNSVGSKASPTKSNNNSYQSLNKLPVYMQGSKCLGARIAQSDYVDPTTLIPEKTSLKNLNVLINKSAVRPDSLFSNSSFVTSSSEGTFKEIQKETTEAMETVVEAKSPESATISDDSFYEKSFEKIEQVTDDDVFRDSAVYSDQEETEDSKTDSSGRGKTVTKSIKSTDTVQRKSSFKTEKVIVTSNMTELKTVMHTKVTVVSKVQVAKTDQKPQINKHKPKLAPPVPVKPKLTNIPTKNIFQHRNITKTTSLKTEEKTVEADNTKTIKRNTIKQSFIRSESTPNQDKAEDKTNKVTENNDITDGKTKEAALLKPTNIQIKRLSFERASLDSATRKLRNNPDAKRTSIEPPKSTTKSVMERRMEIESLTKTQVKPNAMRKPSQLAKPKSVSTKTDEIKPKMTEIPKQNIPQEANDDSNDDVEAKGSWVKQVVNKFQ